MASVPGPDPIVDGDASTHLEELIDGALPFVDAGEAIGTERLAAVVRAVPIPVVAIGGIDHENVIQVLATGAAGVAVVAAVVSAPDMAAAARALKSRITAALKGRAS